ncbi:MAG: TetR/AcrR family transcriptional regulator, partial [Brevibacterium aurantiacum]
MNTDNLSARRRHTRSTLVEAGMSVFAHKGIDGASIEEICEAAGFTRGAFYSNFSSRDDLVLATIEQRTSRDLDMLDAAIERWRDRLNSSRPENIEGFLTEF